MKSFCRRLLLLSAVLVLLPAVLVASPAEVASPTPSANQLVPMTCFAPDADPEGVQKAHERFWDARLRTSLDPLGHNKFQFADGDRWTATATDGGGLGQGDPTTITWSIVPDGTSIFGYAGEPTAPSNVRAFLDSIYGSQAVWLPIIQGVFDRWSELSGVTYVYEPNDDGSPWTSTSIAGGQLGVRGDVRISGHLIDGNGGILAYNFFPNFGDMVLDTGDAILANTANNSLRLRNILAHEHGHGLGLSHVCPVNQTKLMEPFLATNFDGPQFDDILAVNRGYGDDLESNDTSGTSSNLGTIAGGSGVALDIISVDDDSDSDFYSFTVSGASLVDVTVTPAGGTYLSGPQNPNGTCSAGTSYNAGDNQDLRFDILDTDGTTVLASIDATGAGSAESVTGVSLPAAGTYYVEVGGPNNEAQMYELAVDVGAVAGTPIQYGTVKSDDVKRSVALTGFVRPRVVAGPPSYRDAEPTTTRLLVTATDFTHILLEWDYLDGLHGTEALGYLALENGPQMIGTLEAEAGAKKADEVWRQVTFTQSFSTVPVVITQVASVYEKTPVTTRVRNVTTTGFEYQLEEQEANVQDHDTERMDWVAIEVGATTVGGHDFVVGRTGTTVDEVWDPILFGQTILRPTFLAGMQTTNGGDTATLRHRNLTSAGVEVFVEEEQSLDVETNHVDEVVGWIVISNL